MNGERLRSRLRALRSSVPPVIGFLDLVGVEGFYFFGTSHRKFAASSMLPLPV